jgi:Ankyrin repeats (3 copies)/Ankyrin repeats (many copies)
LHCAAAQGHLEVCKILAEEELSLLQHRTKKGETSLHFAAKEDHLAVVQWHVREDSSLMQTFTLNKQAPVWVATGAAFNWLVEQDSLLKGITLRPYRPYCEFYNTLNDWSSITKSLDKMPSLPHQEIFKAYLEGAATHDDHRIDSSIKKAKKEECATKLTQLLYKKDPLLKINSEKWNDPLEGKFFNCRWGLRGLALMLPRLDIVQEIYATIERHPYQFRDSSHRHQIQNSDKKEEDYGLTDLHIAAGWGGHTEVLEWLVQQDPSLLRTTHYYGRHAGEPYRIHPLHYAAGFGRLDAVRWFLNKDRSLLKTVSNVKEGYYNFTPLDLAVDFGHLEVVQLLIRQDRSLLKQYLPVKDGVPANIAEWLKKQALSDGK